MLERRGVEHDLRLLTLEHRRERLRVADVAQRERAVVEQRPTRHRHLGGVHRRLVAIEQHELRRAVLVELTAQLRTDRPAGTRDEHTLARDRLTDRRLIQLDPLTPEQILEVELPQVRAAWGVEHLVERRHDQHVETGLAGALGDVTHVLALHRGRRDDERARVRALRLACDGLTRARDAQTVDVQAALARVVVEQDGRHVARALRGVAVQAVHELTAALPGAEDDGLHVLLTRDAPAPAPRAHEETQREHAEQREHRRRERHAARHVRHPERQTQHGEHQPHRHRCAGDVGGLLERAAHVPDAIRADDEPDDGVQPDREQREHGDLDGRRIRDVEVEAQPCRGIGGAQDEHEIGREPAVTNGAITFPQRQSG